MNITNEFGLPETILNALHKPTYSKGAAHASVTELLTSPRIVQLKKMHWEEISQDASEMVWQLFGSAIHSILEHGKSPNHVVEERLFAEVDGWVISGAIDLQVITPAGIELADYKTTSAYSVMNEKADWHNQLNIYAFLVEHVKKIPVTKLSIVAIIRDWSAREAKAKESYPSAPIVTIDIPLWTYEQRIDFIQKRIHQHNEALFAAQTGSDLPECSSEDMWERPTMFAVKKPKNVRATAVFPTKEEADDYVQKNKEYVIEIRPGERVRCQSYCQAANFCNQFKTYKESLNEN